MDTLGALAAVYVLAWAGIVTGALLMGASERVTAGFLLWIAANALIWALAIGMRHRIPTQVRPNALDGLSACLVPSHAWG